MNRIGAAGEPPSWCSAAGGAAAFDPPHPIGGSDAAHDASRGDTDAVVSSQTRRAGTTQPGLLVGRRRNDTPWTETTVANLRVLWRDPAWSKPDIAEALCKSVSACERRAAHEGLGRRPNIRLTRDINPWRTDARKIRLRELYVGGMAIRGIADELNKLPGDPVPSATAAGLWASEAGFRRPDGYNRPGPNARDRVAEQKLAQARKPAVVLIARVCLHCSKEFAAPSRFLRLCRYCREAA